VVGGGEEGGEGGEGGSKEAQRPSASRGRGWKPETVFAWAGGTWTGGLWIHPAFLRKVVERAP
jgi:hypothetical protein